jgi:hypothetical protein
VSQNQPDIPGPASPRDRPLAQAVEVAALFGDSVVGLKHILTPRSGKLGPATRGLLVVGALLLVGSTFAFCAGVSRAAENQARLREHRAQKKAAHEFRPRRLPPVFDWMAVGGGLGGLLLLSLGVARMRDEKIEASYRIGSEPGADFPMAGDGLCLLAAREEGDGFNLSWIPSWQGELVQGEVRMPLSRLAEEGIARTSRAGALEMPLPPESQVRVSSGQHQFQVRSITPPRRQALGLLAAVDSRFLSFLSGTAIVVLGLMFVLETHFEEEMSLYLESFARTERMQSVRMRPQEEPIWRWQPVIGSAVGRPGGTGTRMAEAEGRMGSKVSDRSSGRFAIKDNGVAPQLAKQQAMSSARHAGILGVLQANQGAFASPTASAEFSSGNDDEDVYGGLLGNGVGEMGGGWGYGISSVGGGGGGTGWGTIGAGRYGTIGHGSGTGNGYSNGSGNGGSARRASAPEVRILAASAVGDLDKNIIRRYIRRQLPRIRHCYEKELLVHPDLAGTIEVHFQISPAGTVPIAEANGLDNTEVENCVAGVIRSIRFPKPRDAGYVQVHYPFTFQPAE